MSVKLAIRISDMNLMAHVGGDPEVTTYIVEVESKELERLLNIDGFQNDAYISRSISIVNENEQVTQPDRANRLAG